MHSLILLGLLILSLPARSEYRAYKLIIKNTVTGAERVVISNFDPSHYRDLYPVHKEEEILLENSWMCYGNTSKKPVCPEPEAKPEETLPKSDLN